MDSILNSTKKLLGITEEYENFDVDIIMHINSAFSVLTQLGVGSKNGFSITGPYEMWTDFVQDELCLDLIKVYIYSKVRLGFDSSSLASSTIEAINRQISELEWRINVLVDKGGDI